MGSTATAASDEREQRIEEILRHFEEQFGALKREQRMVLEQFVSRLDAERIAAIRHNLLGS